MVAYVANAQTIQVYKDGAVVKEYSSAEVDSVIYKPAAAEPRYYYYAGWDCPNSVEEMEDFLESNGTRISGNVESLNYSFVENPVGPNMVDGVLVRDFYYVIIPKAISIYDQIGTNVTSAAFVRIMSDDTYYVYKSVEDTVRIKGIIIKK